MNDPFETSSDAPLLTEVTPPALPASSESRSKTARTFATIGAALLGVGGGVAVGLLCVVLLLGWLLFDVAPRALDFVARIFGS